MNYEIIDFHAHISTNWSSVEELRKIQSDYNISKTVINSGNLIPAGKIGDFLRGSASLKENIPNNDFLLDVKNKYPECFYVFFTIYPNYHTESDIIEAIGKHITGFKLNTIVHSISFMDPALISLLDIIKDSNHPLYLHITLGIESNLEALVNLARKFPNINFVIGHMGYATSDFAAIKTAQNMENVFLESSIGSIIALGEIKKKNLQEKLVFGSEYPLHNPGVELFKLRTIFSEDELKLICNDNIKKLLKLN